MPSNTTFAPEQLSQFTSKGVHFNGLHTVGTATAGTTTNIDLKLTDDHLITGAVFMRKAGVWGDTVKMQVVDVDNMLGYGAGTVLNQFIDWVLPDAPAAGMEITFQVPYPAKIITGLYLRVVYTSTGANDVGVGVDWVLHKVMV